MRVSFRAHLTSGVINLISLIFTSVALFTCAWLDVKGYGVSVGFGLFGSSTSLQCFQIPREGWVSATIAFMMIAFICQIIQTLHVLGTSVYRRFNDHVLKVDSALLTISFICLFLAVCIFGFDINSGSFLGYSYILACVSTFIALFAMGPVAHALKKIRECGDCECRAVYW